MYTLEGVSSVANFITAYEVSIKNRNSHFLICSVFFVSKGNLFDVYLTFHANCLIDYLPEMSKPIF